MQQDGGKHKAASLGVKPFQPILDLQYRLRCRECDAKGKALVTVNSA